MLKPAWYLTDGDFFADLADAPRLADAAPVLGQVTDLIGPDAGYGPALTVTAIHLALLAAVHLNDEITDAARLHHVTELVRLLSGLNLLHAYLTQSIQQLARHTDARTFPGLDRVPAAAHTAVVDSLAGAGASAELVAGHLKEAHLTLRQSTAA